MVDIFTTIMTQQVIICVHALQETKGVLDEGGHPGIDILIYALRCMMFQAVRNERAHGSVGRRRVKQLPCCGFESHECHCETEGKKR